MTLSKAESTETRTDMETNSTFSLHWDSEDRRIRRLSVPDVGLLGAVLGTLWLLAGVHGIGAWFVVASSWLLCPVIVPFALGQIAVVSIAPDSSLVSLVPVQASLFGLLFRDITRSGDARRLIVVCSGLASIFSAVILGVSEHAGIAVGVIAGILTVGLVSYLLHRYLLLELGLIHNDQ